MHATASTSPTTTSLGVTTYVAFGGPSIQLVAKQRLTTDCTRLLATHDAADFVDVTPSARTWPTRPRSGGPCSWVGYQADFVTALDGWVIARDAGSDTTVLARTTDGGSTWTREPGSETGSNGGEDVLGFSNGRDGWRQQIAAGSNAPFLLQHTVDAGRHWSAVAQHGGCQFDREVFASPEVGFQTSGGPVAYRTTNGGATWLRFALPKPSSIPERRDALYGRPVFAGSTGVLPVTYLSPSSQLVALFETANGGWSWHARAVVEVHGGATLRAPVTCPEAPRTTAPLAMAAAGAPHTWWIMKGSVSEASLVLTVSLGHTGGARIVGHLARGLPPAAGGVGASLFPTDARHAMLQLDEDGGTGTYVTSDGGSSWTRLLVVMH